MAWCGFDERMRSGIVEYASGVSRAIKEKAIKRNVTPDAQLKQEKGELKTLEELILARLDHAEDDEATTSTLRAFGGLVSIARYLIEQQTTVMHDSILDKKAYELATLIELFDINYEALPPANGHQKNASSSLAVTIPRRLLDDQVIYSSLAGIECRTLRTSQ